MESPVIKGNESISEGKCQLVPHNQQRPGGHNHNNGQQRQRGNWGALIHRDLWQHNHSVPRRKKVGVHHHKRKLRLLIQFLHLISYSLKDYMPQEHMTNDPQSFPQGDWSLLPECLCSWRRGMAAHSQALYRGFKVTTIKRDPKGHHEHNNRLFFIVHIAKWLPQ